MSVSAEGRGTVSNNDYPDVTRIEGLRAATGSFSGWFDDGGPASDLYDRPPAGMPFSYLSLQRRRWRWEIVEYTAGQVRTSTNGFDLVVMGSASAR